MQYISFILERRISLPESKKTPCRFSKNVVYFLINTNINHEHIRNYLLKNFHNKSNDNNNKDNVEENNPVSKEQNSKQELEEDSTNEEEILPD